MDNKHASLAYCFAGIKAVYSKPRLSSSEKALAAENQKT